MDMEDCSKAFDISKACTLRASNESRYGSLDALRRDLEREVVCRRRARRGGEVSGAEGGCAAYRIWHSSSSSVSVSSSASSALSGYSGGRSEGSSTSTIGLCQDGEV